MEGGEFTASVSDNARSAANLRGIWERQQIDFHFRYDRSDVISRAHLERDRARLQTWLAGACNHIEEMTSKEEFFLEIAASKALNCFKDADEAKSTEEQANKKQADVIARSKSKAAQKKEEFASSEYYHHPETRMDIFFKNAPSMTMSDQGSIFDGSQTDFESLPSESASVFNEILRLENEKDAVMLRAEKVAWEHADGNPFKQAANVHERMWVSVSQYSLVWMVCCSVFLELIDEARKNHQQVAACMNCATIFVPFFPDDYHMHQRSANFKKCIGTRVEANWDVLSQKALVDLAKEANAYKKEGGDEYIKLIRIVKGSRGHRANVKYSRLELCENSNVEHCESISEKKFYSRNLAVGMLKLAIQLHLKVPIGSKLLRPKQHGAGFADYFQRYRHFVPEFKEEALFRCFLIEFGRHVRRTIQFDSGFQLNSNWWSGRRNSPDSAFVAAGCPGVLVKLDKVGLVQLAKSLAEGTLRVLDDFCRENKNSEFLEFISCPVVGEEVELCEYLDQMPAWVEDEPVEKGLVPSLHPLCLAINPEVRDVEMADKVSKSKLAKRAPDLTDERKAFLERKRRNNIEYKARKKAEKDDARLSSRILSCRRNVMVGRS